MYGPLQVSHFIAVCRLILAMTADDRPKDASFLFAYVS
jgi:hypothetical protein